MGNVADIITQIGQVLGIPAALLFAYLYFRVTYLDKKVAELEKQQLEIQHLLISVQSDVSFIRGRLESSD